MNKLENHLLHAILEQDPKTAMSHFEAWSSSICMDDIEGGSFRLIPMLYKTISPLKPTFPEQERMKGIYRYFLFQSRLQMHQSLEILDAFEQAKIETMLLKGAALIAAYYESPALRPMNDIDLLVKSKDAEAAFEVLLSLGWKCQSHRDFQQAFHSTQSISLKKEGSVDVDLHWNVIYQVTWENSEKLYWQESEKADYLNRSVLILKPEMQILHNLAHGLRWNPMSAIRWIPDVMLILKKRKEEIDWDHLLYLAGERRLIAPLRHGFHLLTSEFNTVVPAPFMEKLHALPISKREQKLQDALLNSSRFNLFQVQWHIYWLQSEGHPLFKRLVRLPAYVKNRTNCDSYGKAFFFLFNKARKALQSKRAERDGYKLQ